MSFLYPICYLFSLLPLRLLYLFSDGLYLCIYYGIGYRKTVVEQNLARIFPTKTAAERKQMAKDFYKQLCDLLIEHIKALTLSPKELNRRVVINPLHPLASFYRKGQSIMFVAGHFGNWEWAANALALQTDYTLYAGYQPLHQKSVDTIALRLRNRFQRKALPIRALLRHCLTYTGPLQAITLLIDQVPLTQKDTIAFLNQPTAIDPTAARLAKKCNYPLFYIQITKIKRGYYSVNPILLTKQPASLSVASIVHLYTKPLEQAIMQQPALWLWSHRRWQ
ncbi:lysophospholipid acyltransferase family protein [Candidatus Cardinium hertigii]|uniref:Lipid A biosynthesis palmitoleoyltransferase n=1 Tax=Candidatus Cardinium hertigii TaxID=247481 RepID=A0A2Z3LI82_9BACT|nr:lysophospholipid acyltransferase family protein [Candidatus Cardinium hertigii]AWN82164.1 Lipid A biosynthesis palmitoleoyltransferase [Candidatus Cardinium hertigii]